MALCYTLKLKFYFFFVCSNKTYLQEITVQKNRQLDFIKIENLCLSLRIIKKGTDEMATVSGLCLISIPRIA